MRRSISSSGLRAGTRALAALSVVIVVGCTPASFIRSSTQSFTVDPAVPTDSLMEVANVEVRDFPNEPAVTVLSWSDDDTGVGLRTTIYRDGRTATDHRLFVNVQSVHNWRDFNYVATTNRPLLLAGINRDIYNCRGEGICMPPFTFGASVPDRFLRTSRDSLPVTFYGRRGSQLNLTLSHDLIEAYLHTVDSVSASFQRKALD